MKWYSSALLWGVARKKYLIIYDQPMIDLPEIEDIEIITFYEFFSNF